MAERIRIMGVVAVTAIAAGVFGATAVHALLFAPEPEMAPPAAVVAHAPITKALPAQYPARLEVPSLNIDASILQVGLGLTGNMAVPPNFTDVAWYKYGTLPGQVGSAVIDGHVDNGLGEDGVFKHLNELKVGDDIYVAEAGGAKLHFVVSDIESYPYTAVPGNLLFNRVDAARLNLITCDGGWVQGQRTYDHRLVVYTVLESV